MEYKIKNAIVKIFMHKRIICPYCKFNLFSIIDYDFVLMSPDNQLKCKNCDKIFNINNQMERIVYENRK